MLEASEAARQLQAEIWALRAVREEARRFLETRQSVERDRRRALDACKARLAHVEAEWRAELRLEEEELAELRDMKRALLESSPHQHVNREFHRFESVLLKREKVPDGDRGAELAASSRPRQGDDGRHQEDGRRGAAHVASAARRRAPSAHRRRRGPR